MREVKNGKEVSIIPIYWDDLREYYETDEDGDIDLTKDQLFYVWFFCYRELSCFGASRNGKVYVSNIKWVESASADREIHDLVKNGVPPYLVLEFVEL